MLVVFRVDAASFIGTGHVVRCATLADELRQRGAEVLFICRAHAGNRIEWLKARDLPVVCLPLPQQGRSDDDGPYASWLGDSADADAQGTIAAMQGVRPDWLVVDHYAVGRRWEGAMRHHVGRIFVIDDLADRQHDCDLLLDQNYWPEGAARYAGLAPPGSRVLVGPAFALLRPEFEQQRALVTPRTTAVSRVFVFFGGADVHRLSERTLIALSSPPLLGLTVDLVIGDDEPLRLAVERLAARRGRTQLFGPRPHLADLMARADLAVGAGGATTWERMCVGLPSLVITTAANQEPITRQLERDGIVSYLGDVHLATEERIQLAIVAELASLARAARARLSYDLCDGAGTRRVAAELLGAGADRSTATNASSQSSESPWLRRDGSVDERR